MAKRKTIAQVVQDPENPVTVEILAADIQSISAGIVALRKGRLTDRALMLLIQHAAPNPNNRRDYNPLPITTIRRVLDGLEGMAAEYLKPIRK